MGTYSEPLDRELAKTLVTSKEGELKLNNKGIKFFERYFLDFP